MVWREEFRVAKRRKGGKEGEGGKEECDKNGGNKDDALLGDVPVTWREEIKRAEVRK